MSSKESSRPELEDEEVRAGGSGLPQHQRCRHLRDQEAEIAEEEDSGCECSTEELDGMDAWTKTLVAIKVLTAFKKRRKKKLEQEKIKKERRKTLWKRLGFKLRVFNMFANKISSDDPTAERLVKLKRKLGDVTIDCSDDAQKYQNKIEETLQSKLGFKLKTGDSILTHFDSMSLQSAKKSRSRRKSKVFERTHSFDDSNPRLARKKSGRPRMAQSGRRVSWHSGLELVDGFGVLNAMRSSPGEVLVSPIVIVSCPPSSSSSSLCPDPPGDPSPTPAEAPPPSQPIQRSVSQTFTKERRSNSVTRSFRRIFAKSSGASNNP